MKTRQGFNLVEILVVIGIMSLLMTVALLAFGNFKDKARDSRIGSDISQIKTLVDTYYSTTSTYSGLSCSPVSTPCEGWASIAATDKASNIKNKIGELAKDIKTQINYPDAGLYLRFNNQDVGSVGIGNYSAMLVWPKLSSIDKNINNTTDALNKATWLCADTRMTVFEAKEYTGWNGVATQWTNQDATCQ